MSKPEPKEKPKLPKLTLYCHLFQTPAKGIVQSLKVKVPADVATFEELRKEIVKEISNSLRGGNVKYNIKELYLAMYSNNSLKDKSKIRMYLKDLDDLYISVSTEIIPVKTTNPVNEPKDVVLTYKSITTYSFYVSSETIVRVLVPIPGIEKVKKEDVIATFTEDSIDVRVNNALNGNNYRFAVPKLDAKIIPEKSEAFPKGDKLIIRLRKFKNDDHWTYLFKQKYVGE